MPPGQITVAAQFRMLMEWLPALQLLPLIALAKPGRDQALQVVRLFEVVAAKTTGVTDDELTQLVKDILLTEQGGKLVDYIATKVRSLTDETA